MVPCLTRVTLVVVTDVGSSASLNVAVGATLTGWPVAPLAGVVLATVGGVVSAGGCRREGPGHVGGQDVAGDVLDPAGAALGPGDVGRRRRSGPHSG